MGDIADMYDYYDPDFDNQVVTCKFCGRDDLEWGKVVKADEFEVLAATPGRLSMSATANNNAWKVLRDAQGFPAQLDRAGFFSLLVGLQRDGLVTEREYLNEHRRKHKCLELTELGRMRAAQGSSAPSSWRDSDE